MAAVPVSASSRRRSLALTERRLAANRRNARHSTGPRTVEGKAKVARNPIKHGFFVAQEKWTPSQHRDFEELQLGLCEEFQPQGRREEACVATIAASYVRMATMLRWENIAALKYHQQCEREMEQRIASADEAEAARLEAHRESLRRAGLWRPTLPGPREANAIIRYSGWLDRAIGRATSELEGLKRLRKGVTSRHSRGQKQTHFAASQRSGREVAEGPKWPRKWEKLLEALEEQSHSSAESPNEKSQEQTHFKDANASYECEKTNPLGAIGETGPEALRRTSSDTRVGNETEKTNPLTSMITGNRHERRRAKALARRSAP